MVKRSYRLKDSIFVHVYTFIIARYVYSKSPENKMWYFSFKQIMQFLESGEYALALSRGEYKNLLTKWLLN